MRDPWLFQGLFYAQKSFENNSLLWFTDFKKWSIMDSDGTERFLGGRE